ncbi:methylated-DNA--[protein]-cysteine S-methyltransferase [Acidipropionibacterium acidipropionici]|uniref:methylated-DNA--[protein]-cysteine S-methyltransferase n=1 Tax=Acidipropionibacterium acidipropionici TaxID=1748 RepID=UPI00110B66A5|nr:methylated-DNA--[protein]-cysteine S-methyltransferase [Acidipropionibacterium acidipropionici]QCV95516.1 methylated-DNA--[protein]-cysteine S-methyltransferase [Acidipropionibacterium acidipropionici]
MTITDEFPVAEPDLTRLRSRLAAEAGDLIDIAYRTLDSPVGDLLLAATRTGLVRVAFRSEGFDAVLEDLAERFGARVLEAPARLDAAAIQFHEYFRGDRRSFDLPLDRSLSIGFRGEVQEWLPHIGYGRTLSYKEVARRVGRPNAVRAVGTACAHNPLPVVVPCHRVLRSDGGLGGYLGGLEAKRTLLALEAS